MSGEHDEMTLMLQFGMFIIAFLSLIVTIIKILIDLTKKK